jgi:uncharacterized protein YjbI with pentapeptide repeats
MTMRADELIERIAAGERAFDMTRYPVASSWDRSNLRGVVLRRARLSELDLRGADELSAR